VNIKQQLEQVIAVIEKEITNGHMAPSGQNYLVKKAALLSWRNSLSAIVEQMEADEQAIVDEVNKRWPTGKPQPDDTFVGATPQVPDGMVLVPKEPTVDMIIAGNRAMGSAHSALHTVRGCYKSMIAAAKVAGDPNDRRTETEIY